MVLNPRPDKIDLEDGWKEIQAGIEEFLLFLDGRKERPESASVNMNLYTMVYNMCTQKMSDCSAKLYGRYKQVFEKYIEGDVLPSLRESHDAFFLKDLVYRWKNHKLMTKWMKKIFNYLDRYYIVRYNVPNLESVGIECFKTAVYEELKVKARQAVLKEMEKDREGEIVDTDLLRDTLSIFQEVGMGNMDAYKNDFEVFMLVRTGEYYEKCAKVWIQQDSTPDYLKKAEKRLLEEEARVDKYLHVEGKANLLKEADSKLLEQYQDVLINKEDSGMQILLNDGRHDDLSRMYRLFSRMSGGLEPMAALFKEYIIESGLALIRSMNQSGQTEEIGKKPQGSKESIDHSFMQESLALHDRFSHVLTTCFDSSTIFHKALKEAFESFCNKSIRGHSVPELMAAFSDAILRKGGASKLAEDDMDSVLDKLVQVMDYISDRDMFSEFYRKKLARRLLYSTTCGEDAEKAMLSRLKQQCGQQFTSKMEGMVLDLHLAREKEKEFEKWLDRQEYEVPFDLNVTVLTTGHWPTYQPLEMNLPDSMVQSLEYFSRFHDEYNQSRKLTWHLSLGNVILKATFGKTYDLVMSPAQAITLMCFDQIEGPEATFEEIQKLTQLKDEDLVKILHSLCLNKYKLLIKSSPDKKILKTDSFAVNEKFADRARRIRIQAPPVDDRKKVREDVDKDRKFAVEAAIVRILKSRKTIAHADLMNEVISQLQKMFTPDIKVIKKSIESLIERDYLERDEQNPQIYKYVA
jgi:cullin 1